MLPKNYLKGFLINKNYFLPESVVENHVIRKPITEEKFSCSRICKGNYSIVFTNNYRIFYKLQSTNDK